MGFLHHYKNSHFSILFHVIFFFCIPLLSASVLKKKVGCRLYVGVPLQQDFFFGFVSIAFYVSAG